MKLLHAMLIVFGTMSCALIFAQTTSATSLKIAPLEYKATLKKNERLNGFVDVSNPSAQTVNVQVAVQKFRQINDDGGLQFFDDEQISAGITPELRQFELGPREALRLAFSVDGKALPEGDVFAGLFFTTAPTQVRAGVGQSVRVGTLLSLVNATPGPREAELTSFSIPFIQLSEVANGSYSVKNTGPEGTGFYPSVRVTAWPSGKSKQVESSLVFGGRERQNDLRFNVGYGLHKIEASYGDSKKTQWVILLAPWMVVLFLLITLVVIVEIMLLKRRRKQSRLKTPKNQSSTPEK